MSSSAIFSEAAGGAGAVQPGRGVSDSAQTSGGWFALLGADDPLQHSYLLALRFGVVNLVAFALVGAAWLKGWLTSMVEADSTHLLAGISAVFVLGLVLCGRAVLQVSDDLNQARSAQPLPSSRAGSYLASIAGRDAASRAILVSALKIKLSSRIAPIRHIANSLVILGLIGTVLGFIIALSGVNPETAADVSSIGPMVSTLIDGMSVALYTTLLGAVLNVWLMLDYRILESGAIRLLTAIVERGERP
jgi:hypothetical protein